MTPQSNQSLRPFNTFGMDVLAHQYLELTESAQLPELFRGGIKTPHLVLGGGSNVLFTQDFEGLVIHNRIKGIHLIGEDHKSVLVEVGAGEVWHDLVLEAITNNWYGIENLSLIPGTVGASPIQNIGAYGVEVKETIESVEFYRISTDRFETLYAQECQFGYRDSVFKNELKDDFVVTKVRFRLSKTFTPKTSYGAIDEVLSANGVTNPTAKQVSDAVIHIRSTKLPDPSLIGNAGSFFKNPVISQGDFDVLKSKFPEVVWYPSGDEVKVPAGWLIDQEGWKGKTFGRVGVHKHQALVLVNYGGAKGIEVKELALRIIDSVYQKYGVLLSPEVNIL